MKNEMKQQQAPEKKISLEDIQRREAENLQRRENLQKEMDEIARQKLEYVQEHEKMPNWDALKQFDDNLKRFDALIYSNHQKMQTITPASDIPVADVQEAWKNDEEEFRNNMIEQVSAYNKAKRALFEQYQAMIRKQSEFLSLRADLEKRYQLEDTLPFISVLPRYSDVTARFFSDITHEGDFMQGGMFFISEGVSSTLPTIPNDGDALAAIYKFFSAIH